jgi:hypothetical protein
MKITKRQLRKIIKEGGDNWYRYGYDVCQSADTEPTDSLRAPWKGSDPAAIAIYNDLYKGTRGHKEFVDGWNACLAMQEGTKMKISKRVLRKIIKEEKLKLLNEEPSDYYRDYKNGSISYEDYQQMVKDYEVRTGGSGTRNSNYRPSPRKTSYVGSDANADQIAAVEAALSVKPNNFLTSVLNQLKKGRGLSDKQKSIVKRIVSKNDPSAAVLFENKMKITKRQLRSVIRESLIRELFGFGKKGKKKESALQAAMNASQQTKSPIDLKGFATTIAAYAFEEDTGGLDMRNPQHLEQLATSDKEIRRVGKQNGHSDKEVKAFLALNTEKRKEYLK